MLECTVCGQEVLWDICMFIPFEDMAVIGAVDSTV